MDVNRLTFDLAVYEVQVTDNWCAPDYAKEHFEKGVFIVHDGVSYQFCSWCGGSEYVYTVGIPSDVILGVMAKEIKKGVESALGEVLGNISSRLSQIARLTGECKDEVVKSATRVVDQLDSQRDAEAREFTLVMEGMKGLYDAMPKNVGGEGVNILDVARAAAPFLYINPDGITHGGSFEWFNLHEYEEISVDDILSIEIVEEKQCSEEGALDLISTVGARLSEVLRRMEGHKHIVITEDDVILYDEGMSLFHSDPF